MFGGDLQALYYEIYRLVSRLHFTPEYVESIAPIERHLFLLEYEQELKDREDIESNEAPAGNSRILGDPANYT